MNRIATKEPAFSGDDIVAGWRDRDENRLLVTAIGVLDATTSSRTATRTSR